jgi:hypothetical protein
MKKSHTIKGCKYFVLLLFVFTLLVSCKRNHARISAAERAVVRDSMISMYSNIARDVSSKGPAAWVNYFEDTPDFFMANDGQLVFRDYQSAKSFILNTVVKMIPHITLRWSHLRIEPLNARLASLGADFHEDQVLSNGKKLSINGYFTGIAHYDGRAWKLRNCHWSARAK